MKIPKEFYYITHIDNLKSTLQHGILSRSKIRNLLNRIKLPNVKPIHNEDVIQRRKNKTFKNKSLWDYANVYFQVRNPMLYTVIDKFEPDNIVVLQINSDIIHGSNIGITDGNAASENTQIFEDKNQGLNALNLEQFEKEYWNESDKRSLMAELLVYECIPAEKIIGIYTASEKAAEKIRKNILGPLNIIPNRKMFFLPDFQKRISNKIIISKGDMFFSKMQTFTISVNTVGVMGKGLASRTKYQFPDVYVKYQDICRQKKLKIGVPFLYKREENFEKTLLEDTTSVTTENGNRWFLLFPTKNHWKENSPLEGIEKGLKWLSTHHESLGIESLALPSLGCGLGGLEWRQVGPLMCKYLNQMNQIKHASVYLPAETEIPREQLEPSFLLNTQFIK